MFTMVKLKVYYDISYLIDFNFVFHDNMTQKFIQGENLDSKIYLQAIKFISQPRKYPQKMAHPVSQSMGVTPPPPSYYRIELNSNQPIPAFSTLGHPDSFSKLHHSDLLDFMCQVIGKLDQDYDTGNLNLRSSV